MSIKSLATSLTLAIANLTLIGLLNLAAFCHIYLGDLIAALTPLVIVPFLVLATLGFAIKDLWFPKTRIQGAFALGLSAPIAIYYWTYARF